MKFACDCHVHVFGPFDRFPLSADRNYTPGPASVEDLAALHQKLGIERVVIVQASPQGADNACLVDALERLNAMGRGARGVAVIDSNTTDAAIERMHRAGVRGVRVNLEAAGQHDPAVAGKLMRDAAARVARFGWHVQTYTTLSVIASIETTLFGLPVPLVIDHFGRAAAAKGTGQPGFDVLRRLVATGKAYVKLSAAHRISERPDCADAAPVVRALIEANPERVLWGTDWPHPGAWPGVPRVREKVEPFHPVDDAAALDRMSKWAGTEELAALLVRNPAHLYDF